MRVITENKILGNPLLQMIDQGNLIKLSSTDYSKLDYDRAWSSQEWKSEVATHDRSGKPDKTSCNTVQQICPHHGDALLDGAAQSVRYGGIIRDRSGQPDNVNSKEVADSTNFVMGSGAAEFVNKVMIKCEKDREECPTLQAQDRNIQ